MRSLGREAEADRQWNGNKAKKKKGEKKFRQGDDLSKGITQIEP